MEEKIIKIVNKINYEKGKNYNQENIELKKIIHLANKSKIYKFEVKSQNTDNIYKIDITTKNNEIYLTYCSCQQYEKERMCKHIAATIIKEQNKIFETKTPIHIESTTDLILNNIIKFNKEINILNLKIELIIANGYRQGLYVKLKIGKNKDYTIGSKIKLFFDNFIEEDGEIYFGKELTYDAATDKFNEEDTKILNYLSTIYYKSLNTYYYNTDIYIPNNKIKELMTLLKNKEYDIYEYGSFKGYEDKNPFNITLKKTKDYYSFEIKLEENTHQLTYNLIEKDKKIYLLNDKFINLALQLKKQNITTLQFKDEQITKFVENIIPIVKENIKIDEEIKDKFEIIEPIPKLYFDLKDETIICDIIFKYKEEINYFDNTQIPRNKTFEKSIINEIKSYNFEEKDNQFQLKNINNIGNFIENELIEISKKYEVYTTKKIDETNIIKKNKIEAQFSIGQDNILSYNFDLGQINNKELEKIFNSLHENKKYYKLKNGNIINLEKNKELLQLENLINDMDINYNNLSNTIPKYRAIYLDSLKEYKFLKTNNLFKEFIENFKNYKNKEPYISPKDKEILRDYQQIGVKWLYNIYKCDLGSILADEMGLGKSIQAICFIKSLLHENKNHKFLIVSPTSLIYNWQKEFEKFASNIKYQVIAESKNKRKELLNSSETNVIITTYGLLKQDFEEYQKKQFEVMIIDEAQNIKNPKTAISQTVKKINSKTKIALSGTPIENSIIELWSIFEFIMPGYFTNLNKFQNKYNIKEFTKEKLEILNNLNKQISPFILRRKKQDVAKELPKKIENNIYLDMYPEQKKLYIAQVNKTKEEMEEIIKTDGFIKARFKILQLLTKLRQICIDPSIVFNNYKGESTKINELTNIVQKIIENNHKILIFTSFKTALNIVKEKLEKNNIKTYTIDGSISSKKRMELVDKFNIDDTNVFLIMLKAGGTGLNLTSADVVIHLDLWWNPQVENQATDRAHRIGQKNNVEVIKLICKGTIEEKIIELQNKKKILSDNLIEGENRDENIISKLSEKEIKQLLITI